MSQDVLVQNSVERRNKQSYKATRPKTGIDNLKDKYSSQLLMLCELFPTWNEDDLVAVIAELNGDLELAVNRITEGHADQWSSTGKKVVKKEAPKTRYSNSSESKFPKKKFEGAPASTPSTKAVPQPVAELETLTWDVQAPPAVEVEKVLEKEPAIVTDDKKADVKVEENVPAPATPSVEATVAAAPKKFVSINSGKPREKASSKKNNSFDMKTLESSLIPGEEEAVVLLPNIRRHLAPEIEPSPVLLPMSVGLKSCGNIKFGQSSSNTAPTSTNQLVFGESSQSNANIGSVTAAASEEHVGSGLSSSMNPSGYTTTSIDALPSPIGSPNSPFGSQEAQLQDASPFSSSPPGLSSTVANNSMNYYHNSRFPPSSQNHQQQQQLRGQAPPPHLGFDQMESARYPHYSGNHHQHHHRQAYDPYTAHHQNQQQQQQQSSHQSRYDVPFNSRYAVPYGAGAVQPSTDDSFGSSNYYGRGGQNSYYQSYAAQQMMYGGVSESAAAYAVGSATSNFTPASARYQPSANPSATFMTAQSQHHHHHQQQQHHHQAQQQQHYSSYSAASNSQQVSGASAAANAFPGNPINRSPSRMF